MEAKKISKEFTVDMSDELPQMVDLENSVIGKGEVVMVERDQRVYSIKEKNRNHWASIRCYYEGVDIGDNIDEGEMSDGELVLRHGCHVWVGGDAFYQAFEHASVDHYDSDGDVNEIREMYRRLQEFAIQNKWITVRASNSLEVKLY